MTELWGKKIGMTQVFVEDKVVPVTAVDVAGWLVSRVKTIEKDGYNAVAMALPRNRYLSEAFSTDWLKKPKKYFLHIKEIKVEDVSGAEVGKPADFHTVFAIDDTVHVSGVTKGAGFQGVVKRHGFSGGGASHGSTLGKHPGSMSFMRSRGRVIKGKRLPGHMGVVKRVVQGLKVVQIVPESQVILVKGSVPGKTGSLVFIKKAKA